jgi:hypothetical protein
MISGPRMKADSLSTLAVIVSGSDVGHAVGLIGEASQIADAITPPALHAITMQAIAQIAATRHPSHVADPFEIQACKILAQALNKDVSWKESIQVLAALQPSVLSEVGRLVVKRFKAEELGDKFDDRCVPNPSGSN